MRTWGRALAGLGLMTGILVAIAAIVALRSDATPEVSQLAAPSPQLLFSELSGETTTFWLARADDPGSRRSLVTLSHRQGYGPRAALSPDGRYLAVTLLAPTAVDQGSDASLWLVEVPSGSARQLVGGVDLRQTPRWADNSQDMAFRRVVVLPGEPPLRRFDVLKGSVGRPGESTVVASASSADIQNFSPIAWTTDNRRVLLLRFARQGAEVWEADASGVRSLARVSDGLAQEFDRSPDGRYLAFVRPAADGGPNSIETLDLQAQSVRRLTTSAQALYSPVWSADSRAVAYGVANSADRRRSAVNRAGADGADMSPLNAPANDGFDIPLGWSQDGRFLAVRALFGSSASEITGENLVVIESATARRASVVAAGYVQFVAWLP